MAGLFITIEGIEGAGKTSIAEKLELWLKEKGISVFRTREPGGTHLGESLRNIILDATIPLCVEAELLLIESARAQLMRDVILPKLEPGETVILDRHIDSTTAYQGYGRGLDKRIIHTLNTFTCAGREPDLTILLDIDAETGLERAKRITQKTSLKDRFETEHIAFMARIREGFLRIADENPQRVVVVSAKEEIQSVWESVVAQLSKRSFFTESHNT